MCQTRVDTFVY